MDPERTLGRAAILSASRNNLMNFLLLIHITFGKCIKRTIYCKYNQL